MFLKKLLIEKKKLVRNFIKQNITIKKVVSSKRAALFFNK